MIWIIVLYVQYIIKYNDVLNRNHSQYYIQNIYIIKSKNNDNSNIHTFSNFH